MAVADILTLDSYLGDLDPDVLIMESIISPLPKGLDLFISNARELHGDRYDYSKVIWGSNKDRAYALYMVASYREQTTILVKEKAALVVPDTTTTWCTSGTRMGIFIR